MRRHCAAWPWRQSGQDEYRRSGRRARGEVMEPELRATFAASPLRRMRLDSKSNFHRKSLVYAVFISTADALQPGNSSVTRSWPVDTTRAPRACRPQAVFTAGRGQTLARFRHPTAKACKARIRQAACRVVSANLKDTANQPSGVTRTVAALLGNAPGERPSEGEWRALVESVAAGDQRALRALYDRTHRIVFTLIRRIVDGRESAEELTADVYHEVWRRAAQYEAAAGSVIAWIMNLARSRAIDRVRFDHRKKRFGSDPDALTEPSGDPCSEALELTQRAQVVKEALRVLTPEERQVIETAYLFDMTYAEVANFLDQPPGTVKTRIRSGLTKLRVALASAGDAV